MGKLMLIDTDDDLTKKYYEECKKQVLNKEIVTSSARNSKRNGFEVVDGKENYTVSTENKKWIFPKSISAENTEVEHKEAEIYLKSKIQENKEKYLKLFPILSEYNKEFKTEFEIHQEMKKISLEYLDNNYKNNWFFIGGQIGSGKTHLCVSMINNILENDNYSINVLKFSKAFKELKSFSNKPEQIELLEKFQKVDILYIDDLLNRVPTNSDINLLMDILDYRYTSNKTTIFSCQKHFEELALSSEEENFEALFSRIFEKSQDYIVDVPYNENFDFRLKRNN